jgi:cytochrome bd-type quinol oxidase subunit 2
MKKSFNFKQSTSILLLIGLFFNPLTGITQGIYQASSTVRDLDTKSPELTNIINQLENNALIILLGMVVLMGIIWICMIGKACTELRQKPKSIRVSVLPLLLFVAGLSVLGSSCSATQRAMADEMREEQSAKNPACVCPTRHIPNYHGFGQGKNYYPYDSYSNWHTSSICKHCGKRIF